MPQHILLGLIMVLVGEGGGRRGEGMGAGQGQGGMFIVGWARCCGRWGGEKWHGEGWGDEGEVKGRQKGGS